MKALIRFVSKWATVGLLVPVFWSLYWAAAPRPLWRNASNFQYFLRDIERTTSPLSNLPLGDFLSVYPGAVIIAQVAIINAILYAIVGTMLWLLLKGLERVIRLLLR